LEEDTEDHRGKGRKRKAEKRRKGIGINTEHTEAESTEDTEMCRRIGNRSAGVESKIHNP
jgi:hypothetical protein